VDVAKAIALGATLGGMAGSVLKAAVIGVEEACATLESAHRELQIAMFASGCKNLHELAQVELVEG
jgi:isopentenyl-diphosphate delta-isomerase